MITLQYKLSDHIWIPAIRFIVVIEPHRQAMNVEKTTISIEGKYKTVEFFSVIVSSDTWAEFDPDWQGSDIRDQLYRTWFFYNPEFNVRLALQL